MSEANNETLLDLDDTLNRNMDDIQEAAGFVTPTDGTYNLGLNFCKVEKYKTRAKKDDVDQSAKEKTRIKICYVVVNQIEKSNASDAETAPLGLFTETFQFNDEGLGYFKRQANKLLKDTSGLTLGETIKALNDGAIVFKAGVTTKRSPKEEGAGGAGGEYINVQVRVLELVEDIPFPDLPKAKEKEVA